MIFQQNAVTPLHVASKWGHQNLARLLLNMGARIEAKTGVSTMLIAYFLCRSVECIMCLGMQLIIGLL